jgi:hypothetical protein
LEEIDDEEESYLNPDESPEQRKERRERKNMSLRKEAELVKQQIGYNNVMSIQGVSIF